MPSSHIVSSEELVKTDENYHDRASSILLVRQMRRIAKEVLLLPDSRPFTAPDDSCTVLSPREPSCQGSAGGLGRHGANQDYKQYRDQLPVVATGLTS